MSKLPALSSKRIVKILKQHGFLLDHTTGSHFVFYHPDSKKRVVVPCHKKDLPKGTLHAILKQAGLTEKDL